MSESAMTPAPASGPWSSRTRVAPVVGALTTGLPLLMVVLLFLYSAVTIDGFTSWPSLRSLLALAALLGLASVGQTLTIVIGGIDLSIPSMIALGNVLTVTLCGKGWAFGTVVLTIMAVAVVVGVVNAVASQLLRAHPLIVTLATGAIVTGFTYVLGKLDTAAVPAWITKMVSPGGTTFGVEVPTIVVIWAVVAILAILALRFTTFGRQLYAVGASPVAARLALVRPIRIWIVAFVISAAFAAWTGIFLAGFTGTVDPTAGDPYLFMTVAAVVVGGTSLLGGSGGYGRTVLGVLAINLLTTILIGEGYSENLQQVLLGLLIVVLVSVYGRQAHVRDQV